MVLLHSVLHRRVLQGRAGRAGETRLAGPPAPAVPAFPVTDRFAEHDGLCDVELPSAANIEGRRDLCPAGSRYSTLPGFMMPAGSIAFFTARISSISTDDL